MLRLTSPKSGGGRWRPKPPQGSGQDLVPILSLFLLMLTLFSAAQLDLKLSR